MIAELHLRDVNIDPETDPSGESFSDIPEIQPPTAFITAMTRARIAVSNIPEGSILQPWVPLDEVSPSLWDTYQLNYAGPADIFNAMSHDLHIPHGEVEVDHTYDHGYYVNFARQGFILISALPYGPTETTPHLRTIGRCLGEQLLPRYRGTTNYRAIADMMGLTLDELINHLMDTSPIEPFRSEISTRLVGRKIILRDGKNADTYLINFADEMIQELFPLAYSVYIRFLAHCEEIQLPYRRIQSNRDGFHAAARTFLTAHNFGPIHERTTLIDAMIVNAADEYGGFEPLLIDLLDSQSIDIEPNRSLTKQQLGAIRQLIAALHTHHVVDDAIVSSLSSESRPPLYVSRSGRNPRDTLDTCKHRSVGLYEFLREVLQAIEQQYLIGPYWAVLPRPYNQRPGQEDTGRRWLKEKGPRAHPLTLCVAENAIALRDMSDRRILDQMHQIVTDAENIASPKKQQTRGIQRLLRLGS